MSSLVERAGLTISRRSWLRLAAAVVIASPPAAPVLADTRLLRPEDQSARDKSLQGMLEAMRTIVRHKDSQALLARMSPDFKVEFDAGKGPEAFRRRWAPEASTSPVWPLLDRLLSLGGTFYSDALFAVP